MTEVEILVDGEAAVTATQLAQQLERDAGDVRKMLKRLHVQPAAHLDERTPVYLVDEINAAINAMPRGLRNV